MLRSALNACLVTGFCALSFLAATTLHAQTTSPGPAGAQPGLYLVFPFENAGSSPRLDWLGEGLEELTIQYLSDGGEQVYSHAGRAGEFERYGLPPTAKLSRATMLRIAQDLDADYVVFGSFNSDGTSLTVSSRVLRVDPPALLPAVKESAPLSSLMELQTGLVWKMVSANERAYPLALKDFTKLQRPLRLDAFEHFVRGILANEDEPRLRELKEAARLEPNWPDPAFALGETYASRNDCNSALPWLARVPRINQRYVEAAFAIGVCRLQMNQPDKAEEIYNALQDSLRERTKRESGGVVVSGAEPPEVLNNLAIAMARQGNVSGAVANLRRATDMDPDEDDYPFNLGLISLRTGDFANAAGFFREASEREPESPEDRAFLIQALQKAGKKTEADEEREAAAEALGPNALPAVRIESKADANKADISKMEPAKAETVSHLERIKTELDVAPLRLEIVAASAPPKAAAAPGGTSPSSGVVEETPATRIRRGRQEFSVGKLDAAEAEFRAALASDPANAAAHRGIAEVARRRGNLADAVKELQASLQSRDSAFVRTTLAKIYLDQKKPDFARTELERVLKLAPNYTEAKVLLEHLQNAKPDGTH
jgi:tetratricopeptide (TPR) repeat protein/TolB-like protein